MCIGMPMTVVSVDGLTALCEGALGPAHIDLALVGPVAAGQAVLVHVGTAVRLLEPDEARAIADAIEAVARAQRGEPFEHLLADLIDKEPELPAHLRVGRHAPQAEGKTP
jgi:hydrogenase expression/formation protein HypC